MLYQSQNRGGIPEETVRVARQAFPKGNVYMRMGDEMGSLYQDEQFASLFSTLGQSGLSPGNLGQIMVMQYAEGLTDAQAASASASRIDWKYALGLPLTYAGFDPSVLSEFRDRLLLGGLAAVLLDEMLKLYVEQGWLKSEGQQRSDATHVVAVVRQLNRLEMVGETLRQALEVLAVVAPAWLQTQVTPDWYDRYGARFEQYRLPSKQAEQEQLGQQIGRDGLHLLTCLYDEGAPVYLRQLEAVTILRQIWLQQYYVAEEGLKWRPAEWLPPAKKLIISPYEVEARHGRKRDVTWNGYKVHLTESCDPDRPNLVTHVLTTPAPVADVEVTATIQQALVAKGLTPKTHLVDQGYTDADLLVSAAQAGIELLGPVSQDTNSQAQPAAGFAATDFTVDWERQQATCPGGKLSRLWRYEQDSQGHESIRVRFARADCAACPSQPLCTRSPQGRSLRLQLLPQQQALQAARAYQQTTDFQQRYKRRAGIEGTISQAVRSFDLRQARYRGLAKTHLQHILVAAALNLTRMAHWLQSQGERARTRSSHFSRLAPGFT
jgi:transposase